MADKSAIEWTDATWNFLKGCRLAGPDCINCYAMKMSHRIRATGNPDFQNVVDDEGNWTGEISLVEKLFDQPVRWKKPRMIFVNSMSDLFYDEVPDEVILRAYDVMLKADHHIYQILTKRSERMRDFINDHFGDRLMKARHIWHLVSAGNQKTYDKRVPFLYETNVRVRGLSLEPLIAPIALGLSFAARYETSVMDDSQRRGRLLHWAIIGGESGPGARPMSKLWATSLVKELGHWNIPTFFKQWGAYAPAREDHPDYPGMIKVGKKKAGNLLDGQKIQEYPFTLADL